MDKSSSNKISFGEKLSFFLITMGNIPIQTLITTYLLIFYTTICGMNPTAVATLFLITKIFDGVNDPIVGFLIDRAKPNKFGKIRSLLLVGAIICSLNFVLLWVGPAYVAQGAKLLIAYISYILIGISFDLMDIPKNSLVPTMTRDDKQRSVLAVIAAFAALIGGILVSVAAPIVISANPDPKSGYTVLIIASAVIVTVLTVIGVLGIRERVQSTPEQHYKLRDVIPFLKMSPVWTLLLCSLIFSAGYYMISSGSAFYTTYILKDFNATGTLMAASMPGMIIGIIISPILYNRIGKKPVFSLALLVLAAGCLIRLINLQTLVFSLVGFVVIGIAMGMFSALQPVLLATNIDYIEYKKGKRTEGALSAATSFIAKCASAVGTALPGYILGWTGFVNDATEQSQTAQTGIVTASITVPAILCVIAAVLFFLIYPLNKKENLEITNALKAKAAE